MSNEWTELKIDKLPPDILTGDYEFEMYSKPHSGYQPCRWTPLQIIIELSGWSDYKFAYSKPEPLHPTHEEIMSLWWDDKEVWFKVDEYWVDVKNPYKMRSGLCVSKEWFTNRESAIVPPEAI